MARGRSNHVRPRHRCLSIFDRLPRILPTGRGRCKRHRFLFQVGRRSAGKGIKPCATLYHWDLPQALQDKGGWPNRDTARYFVDYTDVITRALGDRVKLWITHNEPWCISFLGHVSGEHAPGEKNNWANALACTHHLMMSHGWRL